MYDVSQMAVLDESGRVEGILDESDVLVALTRHKADPRSPVSEYMTRKIRTITPEASLENVLGILEDGMVAIVTDDSNFYGLITRIDVIQFLREQLP